MKPRHQPQLQLALDVTDSGQAMSLVEQVHPHFDVAEIGTPLILEHGLAPLETIKSQYPDKRYLADTKIADAGYIEASSAFKRGADIVTVLGVSDDNTIQGALQAATEHGGQVMADLMHVPQLLDRARQLEAMGVHQVCLHTAYDRQGSGVDPMADLSTIRSAVRCRLAIAGGIKLDNVDRAVSLGADVLVIGGGITAQPAPRQVAARIMKKIQPCS